MPNPQALWPSEARALLAAAGEGPLYWCVRCRLISAVPLERHDVIEGHVCPSGPNMFVVLDPALRAQLEDVARRAA